VVLRLLGKYLLFLFLLAHPTYAAAPSGGSDPLAQIKSILKQKGGALPHRVVFIAELSAARFPLFTELDTAVFNKLSFVTVIEPLDVKASILVNNLPWPDGADEVRLQTIFNLLSPDIIVVGTHDGKPWRIYTLVNGIPRVIVSAAGPYGFASEPRILLRWLLHALGYDAVVTHVNGNVVTVVGISGDIERSPVGRVLDQSAGRFTIEADVKSVITELKLISAKGAVGEFKIQGLPNDRNPIVVGSKVVF